MTALVWYLGASRVLAVVYICIGLLLAWKDEP